MPSPGALGEVGRIASAIHVTTGILLFVIFSPLYSWIDLFVGVPLRIIARRAGLAGWLVAVAYVGSAALAINVILIGSASDRGPLVGWLSFATCAGAALGAALWLGMRVTATCFARWKHPPRAKAESAGSWRRPNHRSGDGINTATRVAPCTDGFRASRRQGCAPRSLAFSSG